MIKKRILSMLVLLMVAVTGAWAETTIVTWTSSGSYENNNSRGGVTLSGDVVEYIWDELTGGEWRLAYDSNQGTFMTSLGNFTSIVISGGYIHGFSGTGWNGKTWTGNASSVPFRGYLTDANGDEPWTITFTIAPATVAVTGVTLAPTSATLTLGETETVTLIPTVLPADATDKSVTWSSSNEAVATVTDGVVTAVAAGEATITVTTTDGAKTATCAVTVAAPAPATYTVTLKEGTEDATSWTIAPAEATTTGVAAGTEVKATYGGMKKVKSVKAKKKTQAGPTYNETKSINDGPVTVAAGEHWLITGTGTQTNNTMSIGAGATVTLDGVTISSGDYCIRCLGDATIILKDGSTNTLTGTGSDYPALWIGDAGTTLTIQGSTGVLNVTSGEYCAGIGGGYANTNNTCGNIKIEGGVITAQGGNSGAGIGSDSNPATCGDIIITGGTVTATGGTYAAGIGTGNGDQNVASCGSITITNGVTKVTAAKGAYAINSIGKGNGGSCGTVTIGGVVGAITESPFTYPAPAEPTLADVFTDGAVVGVAVKNTYDTYTVTGTYSGGSYTSYTKSSNDIEEVTMTKDGNNLVVWIKSDMNSECTLTFNTQDNTYTKSFKAGTAAPVWNLSEFVSITVNGTDITSTLTEAAPTLASESFDTNLGNTTTYDGTHFTITCSDQGDSDGIQIGNNNTLTITAKGSETIKKVEFHCELGQWNASETTVTAGTLNWTDGSTTGSIDDVNATVVTMSNSEGGMTQIDQITVYYQ